MDNPFAGLVGLRREPRGPVPEHGDAVRPALTAEQARELARTRLEEWRRAH